MLVGVGENLGPFPKRERSSGKKWFLGEVHNPVTLVDVSFLRANAVQVSEFLGMSGIHVIVK